MRVQFRTVVGAVAAVTLAACAHTGATATVAAEGEVALAPAATARRADTFTPISLVELALPASAASTTIVSRTSLPHAPAVAAPAVATPRHAVELWRGTYVGRTYGQRGAIAVALQADGRHGTVAWRVAPPLGDTFAARGDDAVALVRVPVAAASRDAGRLVLSVDPYFDPACNCTARATFQADVRGDTLVGRFTIDGAATVVGESRGYWRAVRVAP